LDDDLSLDLFGDDEPDTEPETEPETPPGEAEGAPQPPGPKVWSVSQVNRAVRGLLEDSVEPLWIGGEVGGWTRSRAGHRYFTLKDDRAQLRCVMFAREAELLPTDPAEGTQVRVFGELALYEARGEYQLVVRRLEGEGAEGLWRLAFEKLRAKLEAEGLLDAQLKRPLPAYPARVGVVTSLEGAALRDIVSVLDRRAPWTRVVVRGTRVQGEGASLEIASAIRALAESGLADVIIVGRGGGSVEDLWAFNEEPVARAMAESPVPVVSAVGHEVDVTISDLVADLRAPTPSAAAEAVVPDSQAVLIGLRRVPGQLGRALRGVSDRRRSLIEGRLASLARTMVRRFGPPRQAMDRAMNRLERATRATAQERRRRLGTVAARLEALSPLATLHRGYSVAHAPDGRILRRVADFPVDTTFELRVLDGTVAAKATGPLRREPGS
jgi:exodeoxyribonuclease VII large subunit